MIDDPEVQKRLDYLKDNLFETNLHMLALINLMRDFMANATLGVNSSGKDYSTLLSDTDALFNSVAEVASKVIRFEQHPQEDAPP